MTKFTWKALGQIFEGQFKLTASEAATILTGHIFNHKWKHGKDKNIGMIDKAFKQSIKEIFADYVEYIKAHAGDQTPDDEEFEEEI
mgnify:CR=1 FL=1